MPSHYKRKRLAEEWAQDIKPRNFGNYFNKAERQEAKREVAKELADYKTTKHNIIELKEDIEIQMAYDCYIAKCEATRQCKPHNCNCPNVFSWSDEEVLKYLDLV